MAHLLRPTTPLANLEATIFGWYDQLQGYLPVINACMQTAGVVVYVPYQYSDDTLYRIWTSFPKAYLRMVPTSMFEFESRASLSRRRGGQAGSQYAHCQTGQRDVGQQVASMGGIRGFS